MFKSIKRPMFNVDTSTAVFVNPSEVSPKMQTRHRTPYSPQTRPSRTTFPIRQDFLVRHGF